MGSYSATVVLQSCFSTGNMVKYYSESSQGTSQDKTRQDKLNLQN